MKRLLLQTFVHPESGSALLTTLVFITLVSIIAAVAMSSYLVQYRFIRQDVHHVRARYIAEAGVYVALDELQRRPRWQPADTLLQLSENRAARISIEPFGGYALIRSIAEVGRSRYIARALIGEMPPEPFDYALMIWDGGTDSGLSLNGGTRISGDVALVAEGRGLDSLSTIDGQGFEGRLDGEVFAYDSLNVPFDAFLFEQTIGRAEALLADPEPPSVSTDSFTLRTLARRLPSENPRYVFQGSVWFSEADSTLFKKPITIVAGDDLHVTGPVYLAPGTVLVSGDTLYLDHQVYCRDGLFFGRHSILVQGDVACNGQFLSRTHIEVSDSVYLSYPTTLYVTGEAADFGGRILLSDRARIDGTLIHPTVQPPPRVPFGRIRIDTLAQHRGAVYNAHETELHGRLYGTLLTHQTYFFYTSPVVPGTHYVNWLRDAIIDAGARPVHYLVPLLFDPTPRLGIISWEGFAEPIQPPV